MLFKTSVLAGGKLNVIHRFIECLGLKGTPRIFRFQPACHRQGHKTPDLEVDQVAQSPIQPGLERPLIKPISRLQKQTGKEEKECFLALCAHLAMNAAATIRAGWEEMSWGCHQHQTVHRGCTLCSIPAHSGRELS